MNLGSVKPGDIVRAGGQHALVTDKEHGQLIVRGLVGTNSIRRVKAREVEALWKRSQQR